MPVIEDENRGGGGEEMEMERGSVRKSGLNPLT